MEIKKVAKISGGQDGAIYGDMLFRFNEKGNCTVYNMASLLPNECGESAPIARFVLDRAEEIKPHSNAVFFGCERYYPEDKYPILYTNIYNNYAKAEDKMIGVCCAYRIFEHEGGFGSELVQLIRIGFYDDEKLWRAYADRHGERPYGNFLIDRERGKYYAFVMRCEELGTRYFEFDIPSVHSGEIDPKLCVRCARLGANDIKGQFDCPYHRFIQGATAHGGRIYSTEGFTNSEINRPAIRIISPELGKEERYIDLLGLGYAEEAELIDFYEGVCYYSDAVGNLYTIEF